MLAITGAQKPARDARSLHIVKCWRINAVNTSTSNVWRLTDAQHAVMIYEEDLDQWTTYTPTQLVFPQAMRRQSGMRANSSELHISVAGSSGLQDSHIERGLLDGARVTEYHVDGSRPWVGSLRRFRWYVSDAQHGGGIAILSMVGISSKLARSAGETISTMCQNEFADSLCDFSSTISGDANFGFRSYELEAGHTHTRRTMRIRESTSTFPTDSRTAADWWAHGTIRFMDGDAAGVLAVVESNGTPVNAGAYYYTDIVLATPVAFAPAAGDEVQMRVGCARTHAVCKAKFNNQDQFRGDRDIPGSDALQRTPGAK